MTKLTLSLFIFSILCSCSQASPITENTVTENTLSPSIEINMITTTPSKTQLSNSKVQEVLSNTEVDSFVYSPDNNWLAFRKFRELHVIEINGDKEVVVNCRNFLACEFLDSFQWSKDSEKLYFGTIITGITLRTFELYTNIAYIDVRNGEITEIAKSKDEYGYSSFSFSVSPDGNLLAYLSEEENEQAIIKILDTSSNNEIVSNEVNANDVLGNIIWSKHSGELIFQTQDTCSSNVYLFDLSIKSVKQLINNKTECIHLISWEEQILFNKFTRSSNYHILTNSYWYYDSVTNEYSEFLISSHGNFQLFPLPEKTKRNCFDLDNETLTESNEADICLFRGPHSNSPIYLEMMNSSKKYLLDKDMNLENCKDYLSDFNSTNIPDFPNWKICLQTNNNHLVLLEYKNEVFYFMTE